MEKRLEGGINYEMMVTRINPQIKEFTKAGYQGKFYNHQIEFLDHEGNKYFGEYIIQKNTQDVFIPGKKAKFYVSFSGGKLPEILPATGDAQTIINHTPNVPHETKRNSNFIPPMNAQSYVFAMGFAKDIKCKELELGGTADEAFVNSMCELADEINAWLLRKQKEQTS